MPKSSNNLWILIQNVSAGLKLIKWLLELQYDQDMIPRIYALQKKNLQNLMNRKNKFPLSREEASLSKCMAYSGRMCIVSDYDEKKEKVSHIQRGGFFIKMYGLFWPNVHCVRLWRKERKSFPYPEKVSLSKCMAYSGRRDGLFNSHIWEYINLCVQSPYNIYPSILWPGHKSTNTIHTEIQNYL